MSNDAKAIDLRPGELRSKCRRCKRWGRRSPIPTRSHFGVHRRRPDGSIREYHAYCRDCIEFRNAIYRPAATKRKTNNVDVVDDFGVVRELRICGTCLRYLPRDRAHFGTRGERLQPDCRDCSRAKARERYKRPEVRARFLQCAREAYAAKASASGRTYTPMRPVRDTPRHLPLPPVSAWLSRWMDAVDADADPTFGDTLASGQLAARCHRVAPDRRSYDSWAKRIYVWRYCHDDTARITEDDLDTLLLAVDDGTTVADLFPDQERAMRAVRQLGPGQTSGRPADVLRRIEDFFVAMDWADAIARGEAAR